MWQLFLSLLGTFGGYRYQRAAGATVSPPPSPDHSRRPRPAAIRGGEMHATVITALAGDVSEYEYNMIITGERDDAPD